jgi:hypothetical protein
VAGENHNHFHRLYNNLPYNNHFVTTSLFRNGSHLPTTQCARADFVDFATQRNGGSSHEKDLYRATHLRPLFLYYLVGGFLFSKVKTGDRNKN